jgi:hypothetical protein
MSRSKAFRLGFRFNPLTVKLFGFREPMLSQVDMLIPAIAVGELIQGCSTLYSESMKQQGQKI